MVGVGRAVVIVLVAAHARPGGELVIVVDMTLRALQRRVRTGKRKTSGCVVERGIGPVRGAMARLTGRGEARGSVGRIIRGAVVVLVASDASRIGAGQRIVALDVALLTLQRGMKAGQWEAGSGVIEGAAAPGGRIVTVLAACRKTCRKVWRIVRVVEIGLVATDARSIGAGQVVVPVYVALLALQRRMRSGERKAGSGVIEGGASP